MLNLHHTYYGTTDFILCHTINVLAKNQVYWITSEIDIIIISIIIIINNLLSSDTEAGLNYISVLSYFKSWRN